MTGHFLKKTCLFLLTTGLIWLFTCFFSPKTGLSPSFSCILPKSTCRLWRTTGTSFLFTILKKQTTGMNTLIPGLYRFFTRLFRQSTYLPLFSSTPSPST